MKKVYYSDYAKEKIRNAVRYLQCIIYNDYKIDEHQYESLNAHIERLQKYVLQEAIEANCIYCEFVIDDDDDM